MEPSPRPRDRLAAAREEVESRRSELAKAQAVARSGPGRLSRAPEELRRRYEEQARLRQERDSLQVRLTVERAELKKRERAMGDERDPTPLPTAPRLKAELEVLHWLNIELQPSKRGRTVEEWTGILEDRRLRPSDREVIAEHIAALQDEERRQRSYAEPLRHIHRLWTSVSQEIAALRARLPSEALRSIAVFQAQLADLERKVERVDRALIGEAAVLGEVDLAVDDYVQAQTVRGRAALEEAAARYDGLRLGYLAEFAARVHQDVAGARVEDFVADCDDPLWAEFEEVRTDWVWAHLSICPSQVVVDHLRAWSGEELTEDQVDAALVRLLEMPADDSGVGSEVVHSFLGRHFRRLGPNLGACPVLVAHVARLVGTGRRVESAEALSRFALQTTSTLSGLIEYLRYVTRDPPEFSETVRYADLDPEDVLLGACYYRGDASTVLAGVTHWDYPSVSDVLLHATADGERHLHHFKARGLQPRIAEIAFQRIRARLDSTDHSRHWRDLNRGQLTQYPLPGSLAGVGPLPGADWQSHDGGFYDVKCNPFYYLRRAARDERERIGLRGFLVAGKDEARCGRPFALAAADISFSGLIFETADRESCTCVYVGEYQRLPAHVADKDRVLPFYFRVPDEARFPRPAAAPDEQSATRLLHTRWLRFGWQIATCQLADGLAIDDAPGAWLAGVFLRRLVTRCHSEHVHLERALWEVVTETALAGCRDRPRTDVHEFLKFVNTLAARPEFPVRLPLVAGQPLVGHWIESAIAPLVDNWERIRCPACAGTGPFEVNHVNFTSGGSVRGRIRCEACGDVRPKATLVTHCGRPGCGHYPLVIGKNRACETCAKLVCDSRSGEKGCGFCMDGCERYLAWASSPP